MLLWQFRKIFITDYRHHCSYKTDVVLYISSANFNICSYTVIHFYTFSYNVLYALFRIEMVSNNLNAMTGSITFSSIALASAAIVIVKSFPITWNAT